VSTAAKSRRQTPGRTPITERVMLYILWPLTCAPQRLYRVVFLILPTAVRLAVDHLEQLHRALKWAWGCLYLKSPGSGCSGGPGRPTMRVQRTLKLTAMLISTGTGFPCSIAGLK
jgi:hypothetical protein